VVSCASERFEAAALVDSFDFANVKDSEGRLLFDTETADGNLAVLDHVVLTGANTILWRNCGGATMRYQSQEERFPWVVAPLDKRRLPDNRPVHGWLRYYEAEPDILRTILGACHERGLNAGVHWPFEETHWASWTFGAWNFEHPQYWGVTAQGAVWAGRCSLSYPDVVAHKLRLADELLARGTDHLFIDTWRAGGWEPKFEYVRTEVERWRQAHGSEPPADARDPRWCAFVAETTHAYFVALRKRLDASGRKVRLMIGISGVGLLHEGPDETLLTRGVDWRRLVREGVIDTVVVMHVKWDAARPFESTREVYRSVSEVCAGQCQVLFPVTMYDYTKTGIPAYQKATGLPAERVAEQLVRLAWGEGGDGIVMECVDYGNYKPETCAELRRLLEGVCRLKRDFAKSEGSDSDGSRTARK
jgi:hypothetical protein